MTDQSQNLSNHSRLVPLWHFVLSGAILLVLLGGLWDLYNFLSHGQDWLTPALIVVLALAMAIVFWYARAFALTAQDRAIRAEENLRHFVLAGKLLDNRLGIYQIIALRFAPDEEFVELAAKAAETSMTPKQIKEAVMNWRADHHRV
jgi:hypothetical protein